MFAQYESTMIKMIKMTDELLILQGYFIDVAFNSMILLFVIIHHLSSQIKSKLIILDTHCCNK